MPWRDDARRYLTDENYALWKKAKQAGLRVDDDEVFSRLREAEKARKAEAARKETERPPTATEEAASRQREADQVKALVEITAAQRERDRAAWARQEDAIRRLTDLGM